MYTAVGGGMAECNAKYALGVRSQDAASDRLARFSLTQLHDRTSDGRFPEVTVKGDDAMHFGARKIERVRCVADGGGKDVAEPMLHAMQERQQLVGVGRKVGDKFVENGELVTNLKRMV